jgi:hypothetical protein
LPALTLVFFLMQANAQAASSKDKATGKKAKRVGHRKAGYRHVTARRRMSRMRQRARVYEPFIAEAARRNRVDPRLLWTIAYLETRFRPEMSSPVGAEGMMQFMPGTAKRFGLLNPRDPKASVEAAAKYVRYLQEKFDGRLDLILASYNAGEGAVECFRDGVSKKVSDTRTINPRGLKTGGVPPYRETQSYVARGAWVFRKVASVKVFSDEVVAAAPRLVVPAGMDKTESAQVARQIVDRELAELDGGVTLLNYGADSALRAAGPVERRLQQAAPSAASAVTDTFVAEGRVVFYDPHSGNRFQMDARGEIVMPLNEKMSDDGTEQLAAGSDAVSARKVAKSIYFAAVGGE